VGPPASSIIAGYDEDGDVLIGWSFFQGEGDFARGVEFEPNGYFRKRGWMADTEALIVLGERCERPRLREVHTRALQWALRLLRNKKTADRVSGIASYDAWRESLLNDVDGADEETLKHKYVVHMHTTDVIAEGRWYAHNYLKAAAQELPEVSALLREAAEHHRTQHDLIWEMWETGGGWRKRGHDDCIRKFAQQDTRAELAEAIEKLRDADQASADLIEQALTKLGRDTQ
jgi:hypothetical protein